MDNFVITFLWSRLLIIMRREVFNCLIMLYCTVSYFYKESVLQMNIIRTYIIYNLQLSPATHMYNSRHYFRLVRM